MAKQHRIIAISVGDDPNNIERIKYTDPIGVDVEECSVADAVAKIKAGTDEFMVATTVWSSVEVHSPASSPPYITTFANSCAHSNLYSLPRF